MDSLTCATCGKEFKTPSSLKVHIRKHTQEKPYKCFYCEKAFNAKDDARKHMISHSKNTLACISCPSEGCQKKFKHQKTLKRHIESAHTLHKCTFDGCELSFNKKNKLKKHLETHNDGRYLKCTYEGCTSTFSVKRNLLRHISNHEKEFHCTILGCDMVVKSWSEFRKHFKTHKKIHCKECDIVCPDETAFKNHCKDAHHLPKTEIHCPYEGCSKTYSRGSNLNQHIRVRHNGRTFDCQVEGCGKKFCHKDTLKKHIISHEAPNKRTKRKRKGKRKSLAAKLARYNGELCDLPVTYVDPNASSVSDEIPSQECYYVSMDSLSHKGDKEEGKSVEDAASCNIPKTLPERLQMIIKGSQYHVNESCSSESNSESNLSKEHRQVLECSASS